jgi:Spy/CpxP family protein refolding chaperone
MLLAAAVLALHSGVMHAQGGPPPGPPAGPPPAGAPEGGARGGARGLGAGLNPDDPRRAALEKRLQDRLLVVVRQRLNLTDDQVARLREVASKTEDDRRALRRDELTARFAMRQELLAGDKANDAKVADLLEQLPRLERRRVDLMEREQRELAKFLSPVQRARYFGLQDELRRSMQELQQQRLAAPDSATAGRAGAGLGAGLRRNRLRPPPP